MKTGMNFNTIRGQSVARPNHSALGSFFIELLLLEITLFASVSFRILIYFSFLTLQRVVILVVVTRYNIQSS